MSRVDDAAPDEFYLAVGRRVRRVRIGAGISQATLASRIGFTRSSVANLEAGRQRVALHLFVLIAQALNVAPSDLLPNDAPSLQSDVLEQLDDHLAGASPATQDFVRGALSQLVPKT